MASEKLRMILRSRNADLSDEQITAMSDREAWAWIYQHFPPKTKRPKITRPEICFTGFTDEEKAVWEARAAKHYHIAKSVTVHLAFLITGATPGPKKIEKAQQLGAHILTAGEFEHMLSTGETPQ